LQRDQLRIALTPARVDLLRVRQGLRRTTVLEALAAPCQAMTGTRESDLLRAAALDALDAALAAANPQRGTAVGVRISDHFVHYLVLPWSTELRNEAEIEAVARIRLRQALGEAVEGWTVRLAPTRFGEPYVACAADAALLAGVASRLASRKLRLVSLRPALVAAYRRWRSARPAAAGWFAACMQGRLNLCRVSGGALKSIRSQRAGDDLEQDLRLAVERESLQLGAAPAVVNPGAEGVHVFAPEYPRTAPGTETGGDDAVTRIEGLICAEPRHALALA
jgi:hypothetical protein